VAAVLGAGGGT